MRFARALLASLGAGTCLVLAGTLAMATLSTVVAFSDLPGLRLSSAGDAPAVLAATTSAFGRGDGATTSSAMAMAAIPARSAARARRAPSPLTATVPNAAPSASGPQRVSPSTITSTVPPSTGAEIPPAPAAPPVDPRQPVVVAADEAPLKRPVREIGTALGGTVVGVGSGLAETVRPLAPPVATVVDETGKVAGSTIEAVTAVVADLLGGLLGNPRSGPAVPTP